MERRELIQWLAAGAGIVWLDGLSATEVMALGRDVHAGAAAQQRTLRSLDAHAAATVTAAADRIIPADDSPGATDAGVTAFIDRMLADWYSLVERDRFLAGLRDLDARSRSLRGRAFVDCAESDQLEVLTALDDEVTALRRTSGAAVNGHPFAMLKYLTAFGWCTSEAGMTALGLYPLPMRYDGCATIEPRRDAGRAPRPVGRPR